ncbi:MAG: hypothetical protein COB46_07655 [Rhodospirillaceae bacterium]|nr:MAG: hypothetical protein COB46_07655 [Rhodospirillaceae bacterium]
MTERRKRRTWSDDEKRMIVKQTLVPGVSVSQVARRYDVNANLVFKWSRDPRFCGPNDSVPVAPAFLPVEVSQNTPRPEPERICSGEAGQDQYRFPFNDLSCWAGVLINPFRRIRAFG